MGWGTWWPLGSALQTSSCRKHKWPRAPATVLWHLSPRFAEARWCPRLLLAYWAWQGYGADPILGHVELLCLPLWAKDSLTALPNPPFVMVPANILCVSSLGSDLHCGLRSLRAWSGSQHSSQSEGGTGWPPSCVPSSGHLPALVLAPAGLVEAWVTHSERGTLSVGRLCSLFCWVDAAWLPGPHCLLSSNSRFSFPLLFLSNHLLFPHCFMAFIQRARPGHQKTRMLFLFW